MVRLRNSSIFWADFLTKFLVKRSRQIAPTRWCITISGIRFLIPIHTLLNLSMNARRVSPFFCYTLRMDNEEVWWRWLVAYCVVNFVARTLKFPTELGGRAVNHPSDPSWRVVRKTLHQINLSIVYKVLYVLKTFRCSSRLVEPSYNLIVRHFHLEGSGASIISSDNGCPLRSSSSSGAVWILVLWWVWLVWRVGGGCGVGLIGTKGGAWDCSSHSWPSSRSLRSWFAILFWRSSSICAWRARIIAAYSSGMRSTTLFLVETIGSCWKCNTSGFSIKGSEVQMFHCNSHILSINKIDICIYSQEIIACRITTNPNQNHLSHLIEQIKQLTLYHILVWDPQHTNKHFSNYAPFNVVAGTAKGA